MPCLQVPFLAYAQFFPLPLHAPQTSCGFSSFLGGPARKTAVDKQIFWRIIIRMHLTPDWNSLLQINAVDAKDISDFSKFKKENIYIKPPNSCHKVQVALSSAQVK